MLNHHSCGLLDDKQGFIEYLDDFGVFTHAATIRIKKRLHGYKPIDLRLEAEKTASLFVNRLNKLIYGNQFKKGHKRIPTICCYEVGEKNDRPHFHAALGRPLGLPEEEFVNYVYLAAKRMDWVIHPVHIAKIYSNRWLSYMTKRSGRDFARNLILGACHSAK